MTGFILLIFGFPIDCCVRINGKNDPIDRLFSGDIQS